MITHFISTTYWCDVGEISREVVVTSYSVPRQLQFVYRDFSQTMIAIELIQKTADRCHLYYSAATRRTSYLFHVSRVAPTTIILSSGAVSFSLHCLM